MTEVLVGIRSRPPRVPRSEGGRPFAIHLHFDGAEAMPVSLDDSPEMDRSVTLVN